MSEHYSDEDYFGIDKEGDFKFSEKPNPSDYKNTGGFANPDIGTTATVGRYSDAAENFRANIYNAIQVYADDIPKSNRDEAIDFSKAIPRERLLLLNIIILAPTLLFLSVHKREINKDNIFSFSKRNLGKEINIFDFVRYVRYIDKILLIQKKS